MALEFLFLGVEFFAEGGALVGGEGFYFGVVGVEGFEGLVEGLEGLGLGFHGVYYSICWGKLGVKKRPLGTLLRTLRPL